MNVARSFILVSAAFLPGAPLRADPALPTPEATYDRALGGAIAIRRHSSETLRGEIITANGQTMSFIYYAAAPYLRLEKVSLPDNQGESGLPATADSEASNRCARYFSRR